MIHLSIDHSHLLHSLTLAQMGRGFCAPNPSVGAMIVNHQGEVLAQGYHEGPGLAHAEVAALQNLKSHFNFSQATLYVTLEPCCHFGRTPPCTDAIIQSGIKRVVYGHDDSNPLVKGKSADVLINAGISCEKISLPEVKEFYQSYDYWHREKKPFVTAKIAISLNGAIAGEKGDRVQITGAELDVFTHEKRHISDAILTTVKTIMTDNPKLNARFGGRVIEKKIYIIDRNLNVPLDAIIFNTAKSITIYHACKTKEEKINNLTHLGVRCIPVTETKQGLSLDHILSIIGSDGIHDLWVESGGTLLTSLIQTKLVQRFFLYISPKWIANGQLAFATNVLPEITVENIKWQQRGKDVLGEINILEDLV